jgi:hypothetical protein
MQIPINFLLPETLDSYHPTKQRFNMTFAVAPHAQAEQMARDLGFDLITLSRACVNACIAAYQQHPELFRAEAARAKARAAEAAELRAREIKREAQRLASPDMDTADGYSPVDVDDIPDVNDDL